MTEREAIIELHTWEEKPLKDNERGKDVKIDGL